MEEIRWFVMRDLKRANAKLPAYRQLSEMGFEVFTPMRWIVKTKQGRNEKVHVPAIQDLLFVHTSRALLDPAVESLATLQYRFVRGGGANNPMTVRASDMERFITAVNTDADPRYYMPDELTPSMYGKEIRIVGGPLDGYSGRLLSVKGMRKRRLIVELPGMLKAAVEVSPDLIYCI